MKRILIFLCFVGSLIIPVTPVIAQDGQENKEGIEERKLLMRLHDNYYFLAIAYELQLKFSDAAAVCRRGLERFPDDSMLLGELAFSLSGMGDFTGANFTYEKTIEIEEKNHDPRLIKTLERYYHHLLKNKQAKKADIITKRIEKIKSEKY